MDSTTNNLSLDSFAKQLLEKRKGFSSPFSVKTETQRFINDILQLLFPHFTEHVYYSPEEIKSKIILLSRNLKNILNSLNNEDLDVNFITEQFILKIPAINKKLWKDAEAIYEGDPAAQSIPCRLLPGDAREEAAFPFLPALCFL